MDEINKTLVWGDKERVFERVDAHCWVLKLKGRSVLLQRYCGIKPFGDWVAREMVGGVDGVALTRGVYSITPQTALDSLQWAIDEKEQTDDV